MQQQLTDAKLILVTFYGEVLLFCIKFLDNVTR